MSECAICIVEPDAIEREILTGILEGHRLNFFTSSQELFSSLSEFDPTLIIMESQFGDEDGYQVCRTIKENYSEFETSVLFLSYDVSVDERLQGLEAGADDYLTKPYDVIEFAAKIQAAKERITMRAELRAQLSVASVQAQQALSAQSEMGCVLQSVSAMNEATDYLQVCDGLFICVCHFGLKCTVHFNKNGEDNFASTPGRHVTPIEQEIIKMVPEKERIWQRDKRAVFSFPNTSMLVLNMPTDEEKLAPLRNSLCLVMEAFDVRIDGLNGHQELIQAEQWRHSVKEISSLLSLALEQLQGSIDGSHLTLQTLTSELSDLLPRLGLEEDQEERIHVIVDEAFSHLIEGLQQAEKTRTVFDKVLSKLSKL